MPENESSQLSLMPTGEVPGSAALLLVPFAAANLARVLAGCFLRGTASGTNRPDAQSKSDIFLVAHENVVPASAISACTTDGGVPVIVQLEGDGLEVSESDGFKLIRCPIATKHVARISFASQKALDEATARIGRFQDVPWASFSFDVNPALFSKQGDAELEAGTEIQLPTEEEGAKTRINYALGLGGVFANLLTLAKTSNSFDSWLIEIYGKANTPESLGDTIYLAVTDDLDTGPGDKVAWDYCWNYVSARDASDGFSTAEFLEHVRSNAPKLKGEAGKQTVEWVEFCDDVVSAKRDFPRNWKDSSNPALRAVLLFMLTYSSEKLRAFFNEYEVGNRVAILAESLVGKFETIKRVPSEEKASNRESLDVFSKILVEASLGNPIGLNVGEATLSPNGYLEDKIYFGEDVLVSRRTPISQPHLEIFAKAQRLSMTNGYDPEFGSFYIERTNGLDKEPQELRIYFSIEDTDDRRSQKRARFYAPVKSFSTSRAPAAKLLKQSLEDAWNYRLGVGIFEQRQRHILAYFWTQMVDTFDAIELKDMVGRFESALSE